MTELEEVRLRIEAGCIKLKRTSESIRLVGVSKFKSIADIQKAIDGGLKEFGENRLQEAIEKIEYFRGQSVKGLTWHYLGRMQSNKIRKIFTYFDLVQSVDRLEVLLKAEEAMAAMNLVRPILLQVNVSKSLTQAGFLPESILDFLDKGGPERFPHLKIQGLMTIGPHTDKKKDIHLAFKECRQLYDACVLQRPEWNILSMGMTADYEDAIVCGTSMLRIGSGIFGPR